MAKYKGMRQFTPREHRKLERILHGWKEAARLHGFEQYKTPLLDPLSLYVDKTSEEIVTEQTFSFSDRAGREVVLRPEITPGISSMMVELQQDRTIRSPYKVFSIGSVFRYEREQKGRTREHIQFNVDIFGISDPWAEVEVLNTAFTSFQKMGFKKDDFVVLLNDRKEMEQRLQESGVKDISGALRLLDKQKKMEEKEFVAAFSQYTALPWERVKECLERPPTKESPLGFLLNFLQQDPFTLPVQFDPSVVRGFDYYTGIVFEIFAKDKERAPRSIAGGGRYDTLIASYGGMPLPAVGFGMGDVVLSDCLPDMPFEGSVSVILCTEKEILGPLAIAEQLRCHTGLSISFIGQVAEKEISRVYKYYEQEGAHLVIWASEKNSSLQYTVRDLALRKSTIVDNESDETLRERLLSMLKKK